MAETKNNLLAAAIDALDMLETMGAGALDKPYVRLAEAIREASNAPNKDAKKQAIAEAYANHVSVGPISDGPILWRGFTITQKEMSDYVRKLRDQDENDANA